MLLELLNPPEGEEEALGERLVETLASMVRWLAELGSQTRRLEAESQLMKEQIARLETLLIQAQKERVAQTRQNARILARFDKLDHDLFGTG